MDMPTQRVMRQKIGDKNMLKEREKRKGTEGDREKTKISKIREIKINFMMEKN